MTVPSEILTLAQVQKCEKQAIDKGQTEQQLMDRAAKVIADYLEAHYHRGKICILCGPGNNGGDAFATALLLKEKDWPIQLIAHEKDIKNYSEAAQFYAQQWKGDMTPLNGKIDKDVDLILDGLFGVGLSRDIEGDYAALIENVNTHPAHKIAIDIPSGIQTDTGKVLGCAIRANQTITFEAAKPGHFLLPGKDYCGALSCDSIGLSLPKNPQLLLNESLFFISDLMRPKFSDHKYTNGHLGIFGSAEMTGAPRLAAEGARYVGTGIVSLFVQKKCLPLYAESMPGCLVKPLNSLSSIEQALNEKKISAFLMGPGQPANQKTAQMVFKALKTKKPIVLDAGALSAMKSESARRKFFSLLHKDCVLTPHQSEFNALFRDHLSQDLTKIQQIEKARSLTDAVILIKGNDSVMSQNGQPIFINHNAPPFLATAGTGDVLAGVIAGLIAKGMNAFSALRCAVWLSGVAGSYLGYGLVAEELPMAIRQILRNLIAEG